MGTDSILNSMYYNSCVQPTVPHSNTSFVGLVLGHRLLLFGVCVCAWRPRGMDTLGVPSAPTSGKVKCICRNPFGLVLSILSGWRTHTKILQHSTAGIPWSMIRDSTIPPPPANHIPSSHYGTLVALIMQSDEKYAPIHKVPLRRNAWKVDSLGPLLLLCVI